ncbi:MAG: protein TolR [marine bacterium B5-7]|nr:MAG: protein TolR [marine bacterium B5-7]
MASRRRAKRQMSEINVVPYIDVMLVLLIIFMVTAPLLTEGVKVDLPVATSEPVETESVEPFVLTVDASGQYFINDDETPVENPREIRIKAEAVLRNNADVPFLVRGDGDVSYQSVIEAITLLRDAGIPSVGLVTRDPGTN